MSRRVRREISDDAANLGHTIRQLALAHVEANEGPSVAESLAIAKRREHNKRRTSIAELMSAQQDAAEMDRELSALGSRVNNRRPAFGAGGSMRDRMAQAQCRTATAFLTGDYMLRASQMAALAEMTPAEATDSESSSSESSPENNSEEEEEPEVDPDAWKKDMELMAERALAEEEEADRIAAEEAARLAALEEADQLKWVAEEQRFAADEAVREAAQADVAAALAVKLQREQEEARQAAEARREEEARHAEERRQEALRIAELDMKRRQYEEAEARKLAERLHVEEEERARVAAERAARRQARLDVEHQRQLELEAARRAGGGIGSRLSEQRWTPRMNLVQRLVQRLDEDAEPLSLLPRVSLPEPGHRRHRKVKTDWNWVASPRGVRQDVKTAREQARRHVAAEEKAKAETERQLSSSLHRYVKGPTPPTGHRWVKPSRASYRFCRIPFDHSGHMLQTVRLDHRISSSAGAGVSRESSRTLGGVSAQSSISSLGDTVLSLGRLDQRVIKQTTTVAVRPGRAPLLGKNGPLCGVHGPLRDEAGAPGYIQQFQQEKKPPVAVFEPEPPAQIAVRWEPLPPPTIPSIEAA